MKWLFPWVMVAVCLVLILAIFAVVFSAYVWAADAVIPPEPEPPGWDKSSLAVTGACVDGAAEFRIVNNGEDMDGPSYYWLLNVAGGAVTCYTDLAGGYVYSGTVQLGADESLTLVYDTESINPPYRLCVEQREGHPGVGWASATAEPLAACKQPTAIETEPEIMPLRRVFVPWLGR